MPLKRLFLVSFAGALIAGTFGCAVQPIERTASNELSSKAAGYYKYRLSLQRESSFYNQYAYLRIDEQQGKDRVSICKDLQLGDISFRPNFHYLAAHQNTQLGETKSYEAELPGSSKETTEASVRIDMLTRKDGTTTLFIVTSKAHRFLERTPLMQIAEKDFDAGCVQSEDTNKRTNSLF